MENLQPVSLPHDMPISNALTCQKCGCGDATVRQVVYPYVVSLFAITFRREFTGRWCWKHRTLYLLLAVLITGTIGWLGFPFGLLYTPVTLWGLARGLGMHKATNLKLLRSLADAHQQRGHTEETRQCLEASMQFVDDLWGRQQLAQAYAEQAYQGAGADRTKRWWQSPYVVWGLFAAAAVLGGLVGVVSFFIDKLYEIPLGDGIAILSPLFFWMPFSALSLLLIFGLRQIMERILESHPYRSRIAVVAMALVTGLLAAYGVLEGRQVGNFIDIMLNGGVLPGGTALINTLGALLTGGGLIVIQQKLYWLEYYNAAHFALLAAIPVAFPLFLVLASWPYMAWEKLLNQIRASTVADPFARSARVMGGLPYAAAACLCVLPLLFPQHGRVDFIEARDHYYFGNAAAHEGEYERAIEEYNIALRLDPQFMMAYIERGWTYYVIDQYDEAIYNYQRALELDPDRIHTIYELGWMYYYDDQLEKARQQFERTLELDPDYTGVYRGLGWTAYYQNDLDAAEAHFLKAIELEPEEYDGYLGLGYVYDDSDQLDEGIAAFEQALKLDPSSSEAQMMLGMAYFQKNELDQAVETLQESIRLDPENWFPRVFLTQALIYTGQPDAAVELNQESVELFPDWPGAHGLLALSLIETRQEDAALAELKTALAMDELSDMDLQTILRALLNAGKGEKAEQEVLARLHMAEHPVDFFLLLAEAYAQQEKYTLALKTCDDALDAGEDEADVLAQRGSILYDKGKIDESLDALQQAIEVDPENVYAHYLLSEVYADQGETKLALREAIEATTLDRYHAHAFLQLASVQIDLGNAEEAIRAAARSAQLSPYYDVPHYVLGIAYLQSGQERAGATELQTFLDMYEESPGKEDLRKDAEETLKGLVKTY